MVAIATAGSGLGQTAKPPAPIHRGALELLAVMGSFVEIKSEILVCRDEKDDCRLALVQDSQAEYNIPHSLRQRQVCHRL